MMVSFILLLREYKAEAIRLMNIIQFRVALTKSELTELHQRLKFPFTTIRVRMFSDLWKYTPYLQSYHPFGIGVSGGGEAILHAVNRSIEGREDDVSLSMLLVDLLKSVKLGRIKRIGMDDGTIIGDTLVVGKVLELIMEDGHRCGLHLNVNKTKVFWPKEDPRSRVAGVFPPNIALPLQGAKLLGGPASVDSNFSSIVASGPAFDDALCAFNTKIKTGLLSNASEIAALKLMKKLADIYFAVEDYELLLEVWYVIGVATLRALVRAGDQTSGDARDFGWKKVDIGHADMLLYSWDKEIDVCVDLIGSSPLTQNGMVDFVRGHAVIDAAHQGYGDPTEADLKVLRDSRHWSVPLFSVTKPCSACSRVFMGDIYRDHAVSCAEVDIGLGGERDKSLRPADVLLYSWDGGRDVCVDLTGSSPLTQTGMVDFVPVRAVLEAAQRKRVKYEAKCADIGYRFLPFSFSSFGELENDAVTLL
ncbi:hypothetical protein Tco_1554601 [Tanacetum coccineum]